MGEFFAAGEQVEQPLQLGGAYLQVRGEFHPGLFRAAVRRVDRRRWFTAPAAVAYGLADEVIGGPAEAPESGTPA